MIKLTFFFAAIVIGLPLIINEVEASHELPPDRFTVLKGENFDRVITDITSEGIEYSWTSTKARMLSDANHWEDYLYLEDANFISVETAQGSFQIDKNTCAMSFYNGGKISGNPTIPSDTYLARQSADGIVFNEVTQVNNAVCETKVIFNEKDIEVQTIRKSAIGEMKIRYIKVAGDQLKSQMEVINTSGLNNRYFAFTQLLQVPRMITFGDKQIDLATKDGTFYDRDFIKANRDKLVRLSDKVGYDFDKGFHNLRGITVNWDGSNAVLNFDYSFNAEILPDGEMFVIDPTFFSDTGIIDKVITSDSLGSGCLSTSPPFFYDIGFVQSLFLPYDDVLTGCQRMSVEWDISSIPINADINTALLTYNNQAVGNGTCTFNQASNQPGIYRGSPDPFDSDGFWFDAGNGTDFFTDSAICEISHFNNATELFPASVLTDIRQNVADQDGWWGFFIRYTNETRFPTPPPLILGQIHTFTDNSTHPLSLQINYTLGFFPDAVDDLLISNVQAVTLDLDWTTPFANGTITGYQINFTSPQGQPNTIILNDTGTTDTSFEVSGLTQLTPYSFRIGVYNNQSVSNMSGNIANTTTITLGNFTVGFFDLNATQTDARLFKYERIDISTTSLDLLVTYPSAFNTSCNFYYKFAQKNDTYYNLPHVSLPATSEDRATFRFNDVDNEVINVLCMDESSGVSSPYLITQTAFPLLQQFINFGAGTYGTQGQFGAIDLITLSVIIVMMVGFNRVNESVGAIFAVIILGFFAFFDVVEWFSFMFGTFAVVIMLTIASTRKM